jgi:hypothetical protein
MERITSSREAIHASATRARSCDSVSGIIFLQKGCTSMKPHRLAQIVSALLLPAAIVAIVPVTASASGHNGLTREEFDAVAGYTVSIADSYEFPAPLVWQPGVQIPVAPPRPLYIRVGDHHVIIR